MNDEYRAIEPFCISDVVGVGIEKTEKTDRRVYKLISPHFSSVPGSHMICAEVCILPFLVFVRSLSDESTTYAYTCYLQNYS
jgi:hypothetical protein